MLRDYSLLSITTKVCSFSDKCRSRTLLRMSNGKHFEFEIRFEPSHLIIFKELFITKPRGPIEAKVRTPKEKLQQNEIKCVPNIIGSLLMDSNTFYTSNENAKERTFRSDTSASELWRSFHSTWMLPKRIDVTLFQTNNP